MDAPALDAYLRTLEADQAPFTIPGHKRRAAPLDVGLARVVDSDVPLHAGLDTMRLSGDTLGRAERLAAQLWGADWCRFSTGGSTHANQALCLAVGRLGDRVLVSRTLHRSTFLGLVLAGLRPVWLPTAVDPDTGMPTGVRGADVSAGLREHPDVVAVMVTEPGYLGTIGELEQAAVAAHAAGVPLLVDAAWGAHLGFGAGFAKHALQCGADAMVTSAHKTLPAYSQGALLLARDGLLPTRWLDAAFDATHTTSPAGAVLASIDGARALLAQRGPQLVGSLVALAARLRTQLRAALPGLRVPGPEDFAPGRFDEAKLVLLLAGCGVDGVAVEAELVEAGVPVEMADRDVLVPMLTLADDETTVRRLLAALLPALQRHAGPARPAAVSVSWRRAAEPTLSPREAWFAPTEVVPVHTAAGRVAAELVAVYPPGVPVLAPGERIDSTVLAALLSARDSGVRVAYAADPQLGTLRVIAEPGTPRG